jgi:hypothetical protein
MSDLRAFAGQLDALRRPGETIFIDQRLSAHKPEAFNRGRALSLLFDLEQAPNQGVPRKINLITKALAKTPGDSVVLVTLEDERDLTRKLGAVNLDGPSGGAFQRVGLLVVRLPK